MFASPLPHPLAWWSSAPDFVIEALDWAVGVEWPDGNEKETWDLSDAWHGASAALRAPIEALNQGGPMVTAGFGALDSDTGSQLDAIWQAYAADPEGGLLLLETVLREIGTVVDGAACDIEAAKIEMYIELGFMIVELIALAAAIVATLGAASAAGPAVIAAGRWAIGRVFKELLKRMLERGVKSFAKDAVRNAGKKITKESLKRVGKFTGKHALREGLEEGVTEAGIQGSQVARGRRDAGVDLLQVGLAGVAGGVGGALGGAAYLGPHARSALGGTAESLARGMGGEVIAEIGASLATGQGLPDASDLGHAATSGARSGLTGHATETAHGIQADLRADVAGLGPIEGLTGGRPSDGLAGLDSPASGDLTALAGLDSPASGSDLTELAGPTTGPSGGSSGPAGGGYSGTDIHSGPSVETVASGPSSISIHTGLSASGAEVTTGPAVETTVASGPSTHHPSTVASTAVGGTTDLAGLATGPSTPTTGLGGPTVDPVPPSTPGGATGPGPGGVSPTPGQPTGIAPPVASAPTGLAQTPTPAPTGVTGPATPTASTPTAPTSSLGTSVAPPQAAPPPTTAPPAPSPTVPSSRPPVAPDRPAGPPTVPGQPVVVVAPVGPGLVSAEPAGAPSPPHDPRQRREDLARQQRQESVRRPRRQFDDARRGYEVSMRRFLDARHRGDPRSELIYDQEVRPAQLALLRAADAYARALGYAVPSEVQARPDAEVGALAPAGVHTDDISALTGDRRPPPVETTRHYDQPGGHQIPLEFDQAQLERYFPRDERGRPTRIPDPYALWFELLNDGGPAADPFRGINCTDGILALFDAWMHGRPRVSAPRMPDGYRDGEDTGPMGGEVGGIQRIEQTLGTAFTLTYDDAARGPLSRPDAFDGQLADLRDALLDAEHGSFAAILIETRDGKTHVLAAVNYHDEIVFLDPQHSYRSPDFPHRPTGPDGITRMAVAIVDGHARPVTDTPALAGPDIDLTLDGELLDPEGRADARDLIGFDPRDEERRALRELPRPVRAAIVDSVGQARPVAEAVRTQLEAAIPTFGDLPKRQQPRLIDVRYRVKTAGSLARSLELDLADLTPQEQLDSVRQTLGRLQDRVRFRVLAPEGRYGESVQEVLRRLEDLGYQVGNMNNFWRMGPGNRYYGLNVTVTTPGGFTFEIQFSTRASRAVDKATHLLYEVVRLETVDAVKRVEAFLSILQANHDQHITEHLPQGLERIDRLPAPKDTSLAAWAEKNSPTWQAYLAHLTARGETLAGALSARGLTIEDLPGWERLELSDAERVRLSRGLPTGGAGSVLEPGGMAQPGRQTAGGRDLEPPAPDVDLRSESGGPGDLRRPGSGPDRGGRPGDGGTHRPGEVRPPTAERGGTGPDLPSQESQRGRPGLAEPGTSGPLGFADPAGITPPTEHLDFSTMAEPELRRRMLQRPDPPVAGPDTPNPDPPPRPWDAWKERAGLAMRERAVQTIAAEYGLAGHPDATMALEEAYTMVREYVAPFVVQIASAMLAQFKAEVQAEPGRQFVFLGRDGTVLGMAIAELDPDFYADHGRHITLSRKLADTVFLDAHRVWETLDPGTRGPEPSVAEGFGWRRPRSDPAPPLSEIEGYLGDLVAYLVDQGVRLDDPERPVTLVDSSFKGTVGEYLSAMFPDTTFSDAMIFHGKAPFDPGIRAKAGFAVDLPAGADKRLDPKHETLTFEYLMRGPLSSPVGFVDGTLVQESESSANPYGYPSVEAVVDPMFRNSDDPSDPRSRLRDALLAIHREAVRDYATHIHDTPGAGPELMAGYEDYRRLVQAWYDLPMHHPTGVPDRLVRFLDSFVKSRFEPGEHPRRAPREST